jgi:hypothetical protein
MKKAKPEFRAERIAAIIEKHTSYFNGWHVSESAMTTRKGTGMRGKAVEPCGGIATASRNKPCVRCGSLHCFPVLRVRRGPSLRKGK